MVNFTFFQAFKSAIIIRLYKKKGTLPFVTIIKVYLSSQQMASVLSKIIANILITEIAEKFLPDSILSVDFDQVLWIWSVPVKSRKNAVNST